MWMHEFLSYFRCFHSSPTLNCFDVLSDRDGRLAEGDQILAIDGQVLEAAISHQAAIGILQRARGVVDLLVARGVNPEVPHIPLIGLQQQQPQQQQQQPSSIIEFAQQQQQLLQQQQPRQDDKEEEEEESDQPSKKKEQLSPDSTSTRSRSSQSSQRSASSSSRSASPQQEPAAVTTDPNKNVVDVVEIIASTHLAATLLGRSPSALSDASKTGGDMVVCNTTKLFLAFLPSFLPCLIVVFIWPTLEESKLCSSFC